MFSYLQWSGSAKSNSAVAPGPLPESWPQPGGAESASGRARRGGAEDAGSPPENGSGPGSVGDRKRLHLLPRDFRTGAFDGSSVEGAGDFRREAPLQSAGSAAHLDLGHCSLLQFHRRFATGITDYRSNKLAEIGIVSDDH